MRNYVRAYQDLMKSGFVKESIIEKHVEQHIAIDAFLPESASFFYIIEVQGKYRFLGRQQEKVSGYSNEKFYERGIELFLERVHPDDVEILVDRVYPSLVRLVGEFPEENVKDIQFQYNYRFKRKNGEYLNLLEQVYVLELDQFGVLSLVLGNVIILADRGVLPVRASCKLISDSGFCETFYSETFNSSLSCFNRVTARELDILRNLATGMTSREIAEELYISKHTVDTHRRNLLRKLECKSVVDLVQIAFANGML